MTWSPLGPGLGRLPRSPRSLIVVVATCLAALFGATTLLSAYYHQAKRVRADRHFSAGSALAASGRLAEATGEFRAGLALERDNLPAQRALALTLLSLGRNAEAATYFTDLLRREPTDGAVNRGMARVAAGQQRPAEATAYYQRAIYGQWPDDMPDARLDTRFELVDHLRRFGSRDILRAELLRLEADVPPERTAAHRRIARLLADAGATDEAIDSLARAAEVAPRDIGLLTDLADTEIAAAAWADARATLRRALALEPREDLRERLTLVERILALDTTRPRLRIAERTRRARRVLAAVLQQTRDCAPPEATALRQEAQLHLRRRGDVDAEAAERDLDLAAAVWGSAPACHLDTVEARALTHVLRQADASAPQQP